MAKRVRYETKIENDKVVVYRMTPNNRTSEQVEVVTITYQKGLIPVTDVHVTLCDERHLALCDEITR